MLFRRDLARDLGLLSDTGCTRSHLALWTHSDLWEAVGKEIARSTNSWTDQIDSKEGREQGADERGLSYNRDTGERTSVRKIMLGGLSYRALGGRGPREL